MIGNLTFKTPIIRNTPYLVKQNSISNKTEICQKDEILLTKTSCIDKKLNFTSNHLYSVNLKYLYDIDDYGLVPANIISLKNLDDDDVKAMNELIGSWNYEGARYLKDIKEGFFAKKGDFIYDPERITLALEYDNTDLPLEKRIKSIATLRPDGKDLRIGYMQTDPATNFGDSDRDFVGAGRMLMYGACRHALANGFEGIILYTDRPGFYDHIGMDEIKKNHRYFDKRGMVKFIEETENKYDIKQKGNA